MGYSPWVAASDMTERLTHTHTTVDSQHINHCLSVEKTLCAYMTDNTWAGRGGLYGRREEGEGAEPRVKMKMALFRLELA